jgi:hypothetical protein
VIQRATGVFSVASFASLLQQAILAVLAFLLLPGPSLPSPLRGSEQAVVKALACGALSMLVYAAGGRLRRTMEARRHGHMGKLRLE